MTQRQAAWTSVGEYQQRLKAYEKQQQQEWERSRWMAFSIFSPFLGKNRPRTPQQWVKFPWEQHQVKPMIHIDESQEIMLNNIFNQFNTRKKQNG